MWHTRPMLAAALALSLLPCTEAAEEGVWRTDSPGLALGAGLGDEQTLFGLQAAYYVPLTPLWHVAPFASVGVWPGSEVMLGATVGARVALGRSVRLVAELFYGPVASVTFHLYGETVGERLVYGFGLLGGFEWMARSGFFLRGTLGPAYTLLPLATQEERLHLGVNIITLGYKFW